MKYLITGLGNIGHDYHDTRHNIGFKIIDALAKQLNVDFETGRHSYILKTRYKGRTLILQKPTTYVNLSGKAVKYWADKEKVKLENVLIVTDDLALPYGKVRIKAKGSEGGHNGLKSINESLNTSSFPRLRFGIGSNFSKGKQVDHVLGKWTSEEIETIEDHIRKANEAILSFISIGINKTMNTFNQ
jgi:PTH1 family peptidyl-tRNA hydrolase